MMESLLLLAEMHTRLGGSFDDDTIEYGGLKWCGRCVVEVVRSALSDGDRRCVRGGASSVHQAERSRQTRPERGKTSQVSDIRRPGFETSTTSLAGIRTDAR